MMVEVINAEDVGIGLICVVVLWIARFWWYEYILSIDECESYVDGFTVKYLLKLVN